jgi:hypothetical protein
MVPGTSSDDPILSIVLEVTEPMISEEQVAAFRKVTASQHVGEGGIPLTFITRFRRPEFQMLERLKIDYRNLLHTDQEYRYITPFRVGEVPFVRSRICEHRERRSLRILTIETEFRCATELKAVSYSTFVVRTSGVSPE